MPGTVITAALTDRIEEFVEAAGVAGPVLFIGLYAVLVVALVPGSIPSLVAGAVFGAVWGSVLTVIGATLGAAAAFEIARRIGRERTRGLLRGRTQAADEWIAARGVRSVIALRLLPVMPFSALNYAFGLSAVERRDHIVGTAIGIIPGTVAFVALGDSLTAPGSATFFVSLGAVVALLAVSAVVARRRRPA